MSNKEIYMNINEWYKRGLFCCKNGEKKSTGYKGDEWHQWLPPEQQFLLVFHVSERHSFLFLFSTLPGEMIWFNHQLVLFVSVAFDSRVAGTSSLIATGLVMSFCVRWCANKTLRASHGALGIVPGLTTTTCLWPYRFHVALMKQLLLRMWMPSTK